MAVDREIKEVWTELMKSNYGTSFNRQSFHEWDYAQRIEAVRYAEKLMKEKSHPGRRTDLEKRNSEQHEEQTSAQSRQRLDRGGNKSIRDKMADVFGISTATLSKYRSIVRLPDELTDSIVRLLDERRITFGAAYRISKLRDVDIKMLVKCIDESVDKEIDMERLKTLPVRNKGTGALYPVAISIVRAVLIPKKAAGNLNR